jgi:predicted O-methyltransferase YrrM
MDIARFVAELPRLFDEFPGDEHPLGRRFDDIIEGVLNLARENNLALLNLAVSLLDPPERYVEVGTYHGASLIGALRGNEGKESVAIDNFSIGELNMGGVDRPKPSRERLEQNLERFGIAGASILEGDLFSLIEGGAVGDRPVGVYYYDAAHDYDSQIRGLEIVEPYLAEHALLIVDDTDWEHVERAMGDYIAARDNVEVLFDIGGRERGAPHWWEGMYVLGWRA